MGARRSRRGSRADWYAVTLPPLLDELWRECRDRQRGGTLPGYDYKHALGSLEAITAAFAWETLSDWDKPYRDRAPYLFIEAGALWLDSYEARRQVWTRATFARRWPAVDRRNRGNE